MSENRGRYVAGLVLALMIAAPAVGEQLTGVEHLLCVPGHASHCTDGEGCDSGPPKHINVPEFIEIDLGRKTLKTTQASGHGRSTSIDHQAREGGYIFLQGVEHSRAYTMVIAESNGELAFTVAAHGRAAIMFGKCTPR